MHKYTLQGYTFTLGKQRLQVTAQEFCVLLYYTVYTQKIDCHTSTRALCLMLK